MFVQNAGSSLRCFVDHPLFAQFPSLSVNHTLDFALGNNIPAHGNRFVAEDGTELTNEEYTEKVKTELLRVLELSHVATTKVGDACRSY